MSRFPRPLYLAAGATTVDGLASAYFEKAEKELHPHTFKQRRSIHERFVSPLIGSMPAIRSSSRIPRYAATVSIPS
mgnify:CR=1 FL=1